MSQLSNLALGVAAALVLPLSAPCASSPEQAARELVQRVAPSKAFTVEIIPPDAGRDVFEIESQGDKIVLRGNNGVAVACALNWYLKSYCQCHYSLKAQQMRLPEVLPEVKPKVRRTSQDRWRYFLNYCCFGYSLPWYDWADWERLIDWMALNGINAPLAITGQEAVWVKAGKQLGFSDEEISGFLAGPPYLPFGWMGCLDGWGGPLPKRWTERHEALQKQILARQRELGMRPVLQAFTGHVPQATAQRFPKAKLHQIKWVGEWHSTLLDPLDPCFSRFATVFLEEQRKLYGSDHLYAADTFIEMTPPSGESDFLAATSRAIYEGMSKTDPEAVWVLQGWCFFNQAKFWTQPRIEAFLGAIPDSRMLILDLFCDETPVWSRTRGFCGKPWVWCALQNFGDCVFLGGDLARMNGDLSSARRDPLASKMSGIGFIAEGLDYNPVVFDFLFERAWSPEPVDLKQWLAQYAARAYGVRNPDCEAAWEILRETVFSYRSQMVPSYLAAPSFRLPEGPRYGKNQLAKAWQHLLNASEAAGNSDAYRFDLVAVTRQALGNYSIELQDRVAEAWEAKDPMGFEAAVDNMQALIRDVDSLLATRREYLLGNWLESARRWGEDQAEKDHMEWNARRIITMWGGSPAVRDYSRREWSGMLTGFYLVRWQKFFAVAKAAFDARTSIDVEAFDRKLQRWESNWSGQHEAYPVTPRGDSIEISRQLWNKYGEQLLMSYEYSLTTRKHTICSSALERHPCILANDGQCDLTNNCWATDSKNDSDPWWQVDFGQLEKVGRVTVVAYYGDERYYGFTVELSLDGKTWEVVADRRDNTQPSTRQGYTCRFPARQARYLRVRQTYNSANTGRHLVEVMAFPE